MSSIIRLLPQIIMKQGLYIFIFCLFSQFATAQLGVSVFYKNIMPSTWNESNITDFKSNHYVGADIDYWFRLKKRRWEFMPSVQFAWGDVTNNNKGYQIGALLKNQVYVFDFVDDCNCPTFSKQGNTIKKSFFVALQAGAFYNNLSVSPSEQVAVQPNGITGQFGLGVGYDLGITDFYTITPSIHYLYSTPLAWENTSSIKSAMRGLHFGIRSGFRFDYKKKGRMRRF